MKTVTFTEFRRNASGLLSRVEEGETLVVLRHGRPIAEIAPLAAEEAHIPSWKRPGIRLTAKRAHLSNAIIEERRHEVVL